MVSKSGQLGMIKQLNIKLQEAAVWKKTNFSIVNDDLKKLQTNWESQSMLIDEKYSNPLVCSSIFINGYYQKSSSRAVISSTQGHLVCSFQM